MATRVHTPLVNRSLIAVLRLLLQLRRAEVMGDDMGMWIRLLGSRAEWLPTATGIVIFVVVVGYLLYLHFSRRGIRCREVGSVLYASLNPAPRSPRISMPMPVS